MKKNTIRQAKVVYNRTDDSFDLLIRYSENDDWGLCRSAKCRAIEGDSETNFIHFEMLKKVLELLKMGFDVWEGDPI